MGITCSINVYIYAHIYIAFMFIVYNICVCLYYKRVKREWGPSTC